MRAKSYILSTTFEPAAEKTDQENHMTQRTYGILLLSFSKHSHQRSFAPLYQAHPRTRIIAVADEPD
ncbi:uncharacterized protein METZ01_LOCUS449590, partial [marine metagenome]